MSKGPNTTNLPTTACFDKRDGGDRPVEDGKCIHCFGVNGSSYGVHCAFNS